MAKKKGALGKKLVGKAIGAAANFVPGGSIAKGAVKALGGIAGKVGFGGKGKSSRRRSRNPLSIRNLRRYQNRLIRAKMRGKILKAEMGAFKI